MSKKKRNDLYVPTKFFLNITYVWCHNLVHDYDSWFTVYSMRQFEDRLIPIKLPDNVYPIGHPLMPVINKVDRS